MKYKKCHLGRPDNPYEMVRAAIASAPRTSEDPYSRYKVFCQGNNTKQTINTLIAMQLDRRNHGKNIRLETLVGIAVAFTNESSSWNKGDFESIINDEFEANYFEDPPEELFTSNIITGEGNKIIYNGIATRADKILQTLLSAAFNFQKSLGEDLAQTIIRIVGLITEIVKTTAESSESSRNIFFEDESSELVIVHPSRDYGIPESKFFALFDKYQLLPELNYSFWAVPADFKGGKFSPDRNPILLKPLIYLDHKFYIAGLSNGVFALNWFIIHAAIKTKKDKTLISAYADILWEQIIDVVGGMGWLKVKVPTLPIPPGFLRLMVCRLDIDKIALVVLACPSSLYTFDDVMQRDCLEKQNEKTIEFVEETTKYLQSELIDNEIFILHLYDTLSIATHLATAEYVEGVLGVSCNAHDFIALGKKENWSLLSLYNYAKSKKEMLQYVLIPGQDFVSLYGIYKSRNESFYLSDGERPNGLMLDPGTGYHLIRSSVQENDEHGEWFYMDGGGGYLQVKRHKIFKHLYRDLSDSNVQELVYPNHGTPIWFRCILETNQNFGNAIAEAVAFWISKIFENRPNIFNDFGYKSLHVEITIQGGLGECSVELMSPYRVRAQVGFELLDRLRNDPTNGTEKALVEFICRAILESVGSAEAEQIEVWLSEVINDQTKRILLAVSIDADIRLSDIDLSPKFHMSESAAELLLDRLGAVVKLNEFDGFDLSLDNNKTKFVNSIVERLLAHLRSKFLGLDKSYLLSFLLSINERLIYDAERRRISHALNQLTFEDDLDGLGEYEIDLRSNMKTARATRCLIELIVTEDLGGGKKVSFSQVEEMMAIMDEIINMGFLSDTIRFGLSSPEVELLPSGRLGISKEFSEEVLSPFYVERQEDEWHHRRSNIQSRLNYFSTVSKEADLDLNSKDKPQQLLDLDLAFSKDFGIEFSSVIRILKAAEFYAFKRGKSVVHTAYSEWVNAITEEYQIQKNEVEDVIAFLCLIGPSNYLPPRHPFKNIDVYPWRYSRELSILRRPFLKLTMNGQQTVMYGLRGTEQALKQIFTMIEACSFPHAKDGLKTYFGSEADRQGKIFRKDAYDWLNNNSGLRIIEHEVPIKPNKTFNHKTDLGDIDILAYDEKGNRIFMIECKDTKVPRYVYEIYEEVMAYFGKNGKGGLLDKQEVRYRWALENIELVANFLQAPTSARVVSVILSSDTLALKFIRDRQIAMPVFSLTELKRNGLDQLMKL